VCKAAEAHGNAQSAPLAGTGTVVGVLQFTKKLPE